MRRLAVLFLAAAGTAEPAGLEGLLVAADADHWGARWRAVRGLAEAKLAEADLFALRLKLRKDERPKVREALTYAAWLRPELSNATLLGLAVRRDPDPRVRRGAALALERHPDRRAVDALIGALEKESDRRTALRIVATLRKLTPAPALLDAGDWRAWWNRRAQDARFRPADEAPRAGTYEGIPLETRTVAAVRPKGEEDRGPPPDVLVLPPFGWSNDAFGPYLLPLRRWARVTWVRLPTVQALTGRTGFGKDIPTYPVDRLVRALDKFRDEAGIERFVVVAPGASGWIAMRYAQLHEDRCRALILLDTAIDKASYGHALRRGAARGDAGEKFTAKTLLHQNNVPFNQATLDRLQALSLERGLEDRSDLEIAVFYHRAREPQGFATVPEIRWGKRARIPVPSLFVYSGRSPFSGHVDGDTIARHFPNSMVAPLKESRGLGFIHGNETLFRAIENFRERYEIE